MTCSCPSSFPTVGNVVCTENFGQTQKAIFCKMSVKVESAKLSTLATTLQAALTAGNAVITPFLEAPTQEEGEARTFGGGNDTPDGIEVFLGMNPSTFSAVFRGCPQDVIADMKALICYAETNDLGVFLINGSEQLEGIKDASGNFNPIPVRSLRISDKIHGGLEEPDSNTISWQFLPDYSDGLAIATNTESTSLLSLQNAE